MAGPNTTGKPKTQDYNLGRGILYLSFLDANGKAQSWRDLGNAPDFKVSIDTSTLDHTSSRVGLKSVDKSVVLSQDAKISCSLDELNDENLALFFAGTEVAFTNVAIAGFAAFAMILNANLVLNSWYDIVNSSGNRAYDITNGDLTVTDSTGTPVVMVEGTDFEVDAGMGRIFIKNSAKMITALSGAKDIKVTLAAKAGAGVVTEVRGLTQASIVCALKFISENPAANNGQVEWEFHQLTLKATGDFSLIGDDWTVMQLEGAAEKNTQGYANSPTLTIRTIAGISDPS